MKGGREEGRKREEWTRERRDRATLLVGLNQEVGDSWVIGLQSHGEGVACFLGVANIKGLKGKETKCQSSTWISHCNTSSIIVKPVIATVNNKNHWYQKLSHCFMQQ